jgi:hypothetical protein
MGLRFGCAFPLDGPSSGWAFPLDGRRLDGPSLFLDGWIAKTISLVLASKVLSMCFQLLHLPPPGTSSCCSSHSPVRQESVNDTAVSLRPLSAL